MACTWQVFCSAGCPAMSSCKGDASSSAVVVDIYRCLYIYIGAYIIYIYIYIFIFLSLYVLCIVPYICMY